MFRKSDLETPLSETFRVEKEVGWKADNLHRGGQLGDPIQGLKSLPKKLLGNRGGTKNRSGKRVWQGDQRITC